jgi:hypothetical protein
MNRITTPAKTIGAILIIAVLFCAVSRTSVEAQEVSFSGWFHVLWGDSLPGLEGKAVHEYVVIDDQNRWVRLDLGDLSAISHDDIAELNRKRVRVVGRPSRRQALGPQASPDGVRFEATLIEAETPQAGGAAAFEMAPGITGSQRWVNILCRFADSTSVTPRSNAYVQNLMGLMDNYWGELSYKNINLAGTVVVGWYNLPQPTSYYVYDRTGDGVEDLDFSRAAQDCTAAADADVFFPDFSGINLMFNGLLDCCAWGGSATFTKDGQTRRYSVTWLPPWGYENQGVVGHEMGHGFGLPHSSGPYGETYDSRWDVMSNLWGNCPPRDPVFGCIGVHTISHHKDLLGWIPASRNLVLAPGAVQTIMLDRLGDPASALNYHMVKIPIAGSATQFYTVEARRFTGYDSTLPGEAVVIHRIDKTGIRPAQVVDVDNNGDPNDAAAMWMAGETFIDSANGIMVSIDAVTATGFQVTVALHDTTPPTAVAVSTPVDGQIVSGTITFKGAAEDNSGAIQKMEFYVDFDSTPACSDTTPKLSGSEFACAWTTTSKPSGPHSVKAKAYDSTGNFSFSPSVSFNTFTDKNPSITIVAPTGTEHWQIRSKQTIQWMSKGVSGKVTVFLSRDGEPWRRIVTKTANDGKQTWKVNGRATAQATIKVCSVKVPSICGTSPAPFTIY